MSSKSKRKHYQKTDRPRLQTRLWQCTCAAPGAHWALRGESLLDPELQSDSFRDSKVTSKLVDVRMARVLLNLPPKVFERRGRILVSRHTPYKITSINQEAEGLLKESPALGQSVAAIDFHKSVDLLRACSCVSSNCHNLDRTYLLLGDYLLAIVQDQDQSARASMRCLELEVVLFLLDDVSQAKLQRVL